MNNEQYIFGAGMFSALGHPARLKILDFLAKGPASVNGISEATGLKQSMTSQHLAALFAAGVVVCNPNGNMRIYDLRGPRIAGILRLVEEFYHAHLDNLRVLVESAPASSFNEGENI
jgi:ArsR family transcriptional regulator